MSTNSIEKIKQLPIWKDKINVKTLGGGLTNQNFLVEDKSQKLVVRLGKDILEHQVLRSNELIATKAAYESGLGPKIIYNSPGVLVLEFIESKTMSAKDIRENISKIIPLIKAVHYEMPKKLFGPGMIFWVFHVVRNYANFLQNNKSKHIDILNKLLSCNDLLEKISSPHQIVFGHNDLLPANFLNDGSKIWLIDWEYSGFNSPLFDLGGIASNNDFSIKEETYLLENYFNEKITPDLNKKYYAMKCASLLRETMWSMVSEITSKIDFDYDTYTKENLEKFEISFKNFENK
tara:strand:- start:141 stop:1013 length:873 start_codon:yes stop_codon:yes gene_type:complete